MLPFLGLVALFAAYTQADSDIIDLEERDRLPQQYIPSPPYYPTPHGGWIPSWKDSYAKASAIVANLTLAEKVNITSGTGYIMGPCVGNTGSVPRIGYPNLCLQDSALGVAMTDLNTAFPAGITVGATWDKKLMRQRGAAIGAEFRGKGVNVALGPTVGPLGRKIRAGRNWEGFGADPVLQAIGGREYIYGVQNDNGVIATIKHLVGNEQEESRMATPISRALSSNIDDRTLHELYLWPFAEAVRAGVGAVMTSYNEINGSAAHANSYMINNILKDELGFQGFVMCDWLSQASGVASSLAGLDMAMPGDQMIPLLGTTFWASELSRAVLNGSLPVSRLNDQATRILATWFQFGQDKDYPTPNFSSWTSNDRGPLYPAALLSPQGTVNQHINVQSNHADISREIARDSITLLKNSDHVLPLSTSSSLKLFGTDQAKNPDGINSCASKACDKGTLTMGWGSGTANFPYLDDPLIAIKAAASNVQSYNTDTFPLIIDVSDSDIAIIFVNSDSGEGANTVEGNAGDRSSSGAALWHNGDRLIQDAAAKYSTVIVVIHTVGPVIMESWIDLPSVKGVMYAHLPGQEAGGSLTDILFGNHSPSGHLPYSIPHKETDYPASLSISTAFLSQVQDTFSEGLYIDYRYLNKKSIKPRYAFGHGLSYTNFSLSSASVDLPTSIASLVGPPPSRSAKGSTPTYSNAIPPASEVAWPKNFNRIWRYLYPYLDNPASITNSSRYPYPVGYSEIQKPGPAAGGGQGGNDRLWDNVMNISVTVSNTGSVAGKSVVQAYLQYPSDITYDTPLIQLRDFSKTDTLAPGGSTVLQFSLTRKDLSVWDVVSQSWILPGSKAGLPFKVWLGFGSGELSMYCGTDGSCVSGQDSPVT